MLCVKKKVKNMKKLFGTKGQGAMEYLMTYGWAILVVMIVGIAMWQLGIFNIGGTTVTSTGFARIKPQLAAVSLRSNGNFEGVFTNGAGARINIDTVNIYDNEGGAGTICHVLAIGDISAGDNFGVSGTGCSVDGGVGDIYNIRVEIPYRITVGGITTSHTDNGNFRGPLT